MKYHMRLFLSFGTVFLAGGAAFATEAILVTNPILLGSGGAAAALLILLGFFQTARRLAPRVKVETGAGVAIKKDPADRRAKAAQPLPAPVVRTADVPRAGVAMEPEQKSRQPISVAPRALEAALISPHLSRRLALNSRTLEKLFDRFIRLMGTPSPHPSTVTSDGEENGAADAALSALNGTAGFTESISRDLESQLGAAEKLSRAVKELTDSLTRVSAVGRATGERMAILSQKAKSGGAAAGEASEAIQNVRGFSEQIGEIVTIIRDIANRTNLLSMNAAIEAAHAGDSGKGFAVVASEIRKLSENAGESAMQISQLVKRVVKTVSEASDIGSQAGSGFSEIDTETAQTRDAVTEISVAIEKQSGKVEEILEAAAALAAMAKQTLASVGGLGTANTEALRLVSSLGEMAGKTFESARAVMSDRYSLIDAVNGLGRVSVDSLDTAWRIGLAAERTR